MDDLELIKSKINIVDLISEYLPLKKAGVNFKANCPFHQEKTPSFMVSPERGIWHCFGACQEGGDVFKFLMKKENIDFPEALEILAKRAGVVLKRKEKRDRGKDRLFEVNEKAGEFYHFLLTKHPLGKKALDYLHQRGLTDETITTFKLGYAPNSWDSLTHFLTKRGFNPPEIVRAGLIIPSTRGGYDRFRARVMFPLLDLKNQLLGFAGRVLKAEEPKYINTPTTEVFDKGSFLFGLNLAKAEIQQKNAAILAEGEMDMITSFQSGVRNIVATKGTGLTASQIELIKRYTDTILLCFDQDLAGDSASRRGIELADQAGLNIKVIKLDGGKDPAEIALKDKKLWEKVVEDAEPIYDYYLNSAALRYDLKDPISKRRIGSELIPIWSKISDPLIKEHFTQKLAALLTIKEEVLREQISKASQGKNSAAITSYQSYLKIKPIDNQVNFRSRRELLEEYLLTLLFKIPIDTTFIPNFPEALFLSESLQSLYVLLVLYLDNIAFKGQFFNISEFIKDVPADLVPVVDRLYLIEIDEKLSDPNRWQTEVEKVVAELKKALLKASLEKLSSQIKSAQIFGKIEQLEVLNRRFRDLSVKLKSL